MSGMIKETLKLNILWVALLSVGFMGCFSDDTDDPSAKSDNDTDGFYDYVLGYDEITSEQRKGGKHEIIIPHDRNKADAIDSANKPSRLHIALRDTIYQTYDSTVTEGESSWDIFPSSWWPQSKNGIAYRYGSNKDLSDFTNQDHFSPVERYDLLFNPNQPESVSKIEHWNIKDLKKKIDERGDKHDHKSLNVIGPATKWELENHGVYSHYSHPDTWWGHCNGWASYATAEEGSYPQRDVRVKQVDNKITECIDALENDSDCVTFRKADIEGLMSELYYSDKASISGRRCNTEADKIERDNYGRPVDPACRDLNPGSWHIGVTGLLTRGAKSLVTGEFTQIPFVIDHTYHAQVWNYPIKSYKVLEATELSQEEAINKVGLTGSDYIFNQDAQRFVYVKMEYKMIEDAVSDSGMLKPANERNIKPKAVEIAYVLELDSVGKIIGGEWLKRPVVSSFGNGGNKSVDLHPDFYWMATDPIGHGELYDDQGGSNDNPYVRYSHVRALLDCANDPATCKPISDNNDDDNDNPSGASVFNHEGSIKNNVPEHFETEVLSAGDYVFVLTSTRESSFFSGAADIDLYVRKGQAPTLSDYDCRPNLNDSNEICYITLDNPSSIHMMLTYTKPGFSRRNSEGYLLQGESVSSASVDNANSCKNHCSDEGAVPGSSPACYCDKGCQDFGDCCSDRALVCNR